MSSTLPPALQPATTALLVVDMQEKLLSAMHSDTRLIGVVGRMIDAARILELPIIVTEQYPAGLGHTHPDLLARLGNVQPVSKTKFSACIDDVVTALRELNRPNIIVAGIEAHVCVQQTVMDLLRLGFTPFVLGHGISSRRSSNRDFAIRLMRRAGAVMTSMEAVTFEMMGDARHPAFKEILGIIK